MNAEGSWDGDVYKLPKEYIGEVIKRIDKREMLGVKFGITGKGIHPNYQLILIDGSFRPMSGKNHKKFRNASAFNEVNITDIFTIAQLTAVILNG